MFKANEISDGKHGRIGKDGKDPCRVHFDTERRGDTPLGEWESEGFTPRQAGSGMASTTVPDASLNTGLPDTIPMLHIY